jgi:hypothetical protein
VGHCDETPKLVDPETSPSAAFQVTFLPWLPEWQGASLKGQHEERKPLPNEIFQLTSHIGG